MPITAPDHARDGSLLSVETRPQVQRAPEVAVFTRDGFGIANRTAVVLWRAEVRSRAENYFVPWRMEWREPVMVGALPDVTISSRSLVAERTLIQWVTTSCSQAPRLLDLTTRWFPPD